MNRRSFLKAMGIGCLGCCTPMNAPAQSLPAQKKGGRLPFPCATGFRGAASLDGKSYSAAPLLREYDAGSAARRELYLKVNSFKCALPHGSLSRAYMKMNLLIEDTVTVYCCAGRLQHL